MKRLFSDLAQQPLTPSPLGSSASATQDGRVDASGRMDSETEIDHLVLALARWLEAAHTESGGHAARVEALDEARRRLAACTGSLPLGMGPAARRGWSRVWAGG